MLTFRPLAKKRDIAQYFRNPDGDFAYIAFDNEIKVGCCLFRIVDTAVEIREIETDEQGSLVAEGLLRAALGFSSRRGAFRALVLPHAAFVGILSLGFVLKDKVYEADIYDVLTNNGCSCCAQQDDPAAD